jgi:hypothetical protein
MISVVTQPRETVSPDRTWHVVVPGVDNATVTLGCTLCHIVRHLEDQHGEVVLREVSRDRPCAMMSNVNTNRQVKGRQIERTPPMHPAPMSTTSYIWPETCRVRGWRSPGSELISLSRRSNLLLRRRIHPFRLVTRRAITGTVLRILPVPELLYRQPLAACAQDFGEPEIPPIRTARTIVDAV